MTYQRITPGNTLRGWAPKPVLADVDGFGDDTFEGRLAFTADEGENVEMRGFHITDVPLGEEASFEGLSTLRGIQDIRSAAADIRSTKARRAELLVNVRRQVRTMTPLQKKKIGDDLALVGIFVAKLNTHHKDRRAIGSL